MFFWVVKTWRMVRWSNFLVVKTAMLMVMAMAMVMMVVVVAMLMVMPMIIIMVIVMVVMMERKRGRGHKLSLGSSCGDKRSLSRKRPARTRLRVLLFRTDTNPF